MTTTAWKEIAWNGIRFTVPGEWQVASMGKTHLVFENQAGPTMEIVWRQVKGRFSHQKQLKRMAAGVSGKIAGSLKAWPLPEEWRRTVAPFEAGGFEWRTAGEHGRGVVMYCPHCRTASLIHFFWNRLRDPLHLAQRILDSFKDHRGKGAGQLWRMFDICAVLPTPFVLDHYQFTAGKFELAFVHRRNRLILHRWALAATALKDKTLAEFGQSVGLLNAAAAREVGVSGLEGVEEVRAAQGAEVWIRWLSARPGHYRCRLWHAEACNRILGIVAETRRPMDAALFERMCRHYETF